MPALKYEVEFLSPDGAYHTASIEVRSTWLGEEHNKINRGREFINVIRRASRYDRTRILSVNLVEKLAVAQELPEDTGLGELDVIPAVAFGERPSPSYHGPERRHDYVSEFEERQIERSDVTAAFFKSYPPSRQ